MSLSRPRSPVATNGEEAKKMLPHTTISSLSNDLLVNCFACVSRLYYPTLSLVSKSFRSLLVSPELYQTRSLLSGTESCLYVCLWLPSDPNPSWFTLCRKPNLTLTNDTVKKKKKNKKKNKKKKKKTKTKSSEYVLATLSIPQSCPAIWSGLLVVGSEIYNISGSIDKVPSSSVSILDCRSHTWRGAPSMRVERYCPAATVLDGKIYVTGGCKDSNWMEVFDPKTQAWEPVSSQRCGSRVYKSVGIEETIYMFGERETVSYKPKEDRWEVVGNSNLDSVLLKTCYCMIDNVIYCQSNVYGIKWFDFKMQRWRILKGLERLPIFPNDLVVTLVKYGGKMVVLWDKFVPFSSFHKEIWCALIAIEKRTSKEIWGNVEWLGTVLTVPASYELVRALVATV